MMGRFLGKRKKPCRILGGLLSAQMRHSLIWFILAMIGNCQSNLGVSWVSIGYYRLDRLTGASTTQLKSRVVDSIACVLIKRVQRYFASIWSVPSVAVENCTELATWRFCLVSPLFFAFQSVSYFSIVQSVFSCLDQDINAKEICSVQFPAVPFAGVLYLLSRNHGVWLSIRTIRTNINDFHSCFITSFGT